MLIRMMHHIVYLSEAVGELSEVELKELLLHSRRKNEQRAVTGVLLYSQGHMLQVLEGEEPEVAQLYERIARDCRHTNLVKLADGPATHREFPDWSMGFAVANTEAFSRLAGYCNPANPGFPVARGRHLSPAVLALLREFAHAHEAPF
ncbi:BLUF domain-containing protein [Hymenobacter sp. NST-14]|uniref:BLUF domain-containing protein n=1 Tax=Hymenobacter piscis TaxID=2839984 RepID=UPI001C019086|nr:BLUF domain-containing protein [Hymenobacter piscis]MBT9392747.1 BLUF domain-containing protein [Hymenobacter piscis]